MGTPPRPAEPKDAHIGRKAVEMGLLTAQQLADVLLQMSQAGQETLLASTLISRGLLTEAQVGVISELAQGGPPKRVGKYHIVKELGRGGMGIVYEATDPALGRRVALKTLLTGFDTPEATRRLDEERFLREARLCANLPKHPHIVGVYEAGAEADQRFIAMEFIEGRQFSDWRKKSSAPRKQQIAVLRDVALAVDHAHRHGVIHRDLKPANILVDADNHPHVTDFGLAKRGTSQPTLALTATGEVMGTPAYMSPEQAEGRKDIDHRADIWSLGVMLYEILAGRVPFEAETPLKLIMKTVNEPVTPPSNQSRNPVPGGIDPRIESICMKALAKDPQARYLTARSFADDLTRWIKGEKPPAALRKPEKPERPEKPKTGLYVGIGAGAAVAIAIVIAVAASSGPTFDADPYIAQGLQLLAEDKPTEALMKFGRVLDEDPKNPAALAGKKEAERKLKAGTAPSPTPKPPKAEPIARELTELDTLIASLKKAENFGPARDLLVEAAKRHETAEWTAEVGKRTDALRKNVQDLFAQVTAEAEAAKRTGLALEVEARRSRVRQWNWPELIKELDEALANITPAPPPVPVPVPRPADGPWAGLVEQAPFVGHKNAVHSISFSADGRNLVGASFDGSVLLWDTATHRSTVVMEGQKATSAAISPDGKWIAAGYFDGKVRVWDAAKRDPRVLPAHTLQVLGLVFTPDSTQLFSSSTDNAAKLWDVSTGKLKHAYEGHPKGAMCAALDPAGKLGAVGSASTEIKVWDLSSSREPRLIPIGQEACLRIAFMPDGKSVVAGVKNEVLLFDLLTATPRVFGSHNENVRGLTVSPNGRWIASTSEHDALRIWDAVNGTLVETIPHENSFYAVQFTPNSNQLAAGCGNFQLRLWDLKSRK
jgi:serine/threonine protein kinase